MKKIFFLSDAHLGSLAMDNDLVREQKLCDFLCRIAPEALAIYLLGDLFDFWFEYRVTVPKGHTRIIGTLARIADSGVQIHFYPGNHDLWTFGYLAKEIGATVHPHYDTVLLNGLSCFISHGDGLGDPTPGVRFIQWLFRNRVAQFLFRLFPPVIGMGFGFLWSRSNRNKDFACPDIYKGHDKEHLVCFSENYQQQHAPVDLFIFAHRHIILDEPLHAGGRAVIIGDWLTSFSYAVLDNQTLTIQKA